MDIIISIKTSSSQIKKLVLTSLSLV